MFSLRCSPLYFVFSKTVVSGLVLFACLSGCGGGDSPNPVQSQITRYVNAQQLPQMQKLRIVELSDGQTAELFTVAYGPGQDCPSGCFYSYLSGVRNGSKIGFLKFNADYSYGNAPYGQHSYHFDASDTRLYADSVFDKIKKTSGFSYSQFLNTLAVNPDVPVEVLVKVARRVEGTYTAELLIANPTVMTSREALTVLASLSQPTPYGDVYADIQSRARQLLNNLGAK